jgi:hypothetical protein
MTNVTKVVTLGRRESLTIGSSPLSFQRSPSAGVSPMADQQGSMAKLASFTRVSSFARSNSSWSQNEGAEDLQVRKRDKEPNTTSGRFTVKGACMYSACLCILVFGSDWFRDGYVMLHGTAMIGCRKARTHNPNS